MYLKFYGLLEKPFNATPDPRFLYMSPGHREALAQLHYGTQERKGFIVLTGRVGTGKTTLLHALRQRLDGHTAVSFLFNSTLPFDDMLEYILADLGVTKAEESRPQPIMAYNDLFTDAAIERMTDYAGGMPRILNILGDHCLLFGYADQIRRIDRASVTETIEYMEEGMPTQRGIFSFGRSAPRRRSQWFVKTSMF